MSRYPTAALGLLALVAHPAAAVSGTPEEQALRLALTGRDADAVALLARSGDADLSWLAGRYALGSRDFATAARLLAGSDERSGWGRVDLAAARGDEAGAVALALPLMDAALAGAHRDALSGMLTRWAEERAHPAANGVRDDADASTFLRSAIAMAASEPARRAAQDALFRLPAAFSDDGLARDRLAAGLEASPGDADPALFPALLAFARSDSAGAAPRSARSLRLLIDSDPTDAMAAAEALITLAHAVPDPWITRGLESLPATGDAFRLRLAWCLDLASWDLAAGLAGLDTLVATVESAAVAELAAEIRTRRATLEPDPVARRALWLSIAEHAGRPPTGDTARAAALAALLESSVTPETARAALTSADGVGNPTLRYRAILPDPAPGGDGSAPRTAALWDLAGDFPTGEWCDELATRLISTGADDATAGRYDVTCAAGGASNDDANLIHAHAQGVPELRMLPGDGFVSVTASSALTLAVVQHRVDAEALFRGTLGNPLDSQLDAFLLEPDRTWLVPVPTLRTERVTARSGGPLNAITVRAGDQRQSTLVVTDPLRVQAVGQGDDVVIGVLHGNQPVGRAALLIDDDGVFTRATTGPDGIARITATGSIRVMATSGGALGFGTVQASGRVEEPVTVWSIVPWDRAAPVEGARRDVQVFGSTGMAGSATLPTRAERTFRLESRGQDGRLLETTPVVFDNGVAHARIFIQGGGSLSLAFTNAATHQNGEAEWVQLELGPENHTKGRVYIPADARLEKEVGITFSTNSPRPAGPLTARVTRLDGRSDPLGAEVTVDGPNGRVTTRVVLGADPLEIPVHLELGLPGDSVRVSVALAGGGRDDSQVQIVPAEPQHVKGPREWLHLVQEDGDGEVWRVPGEETGRSPGTPPGPGLWSMRTWKDGASGPETLLLSPHPGGEPGGGWDADGLWHGPAALVATVAQGVHGAAIAQPGQKVALRPVAGARTAWLTTANGQNVPIVGRDAPEVEVSGVLVRGEARPLSIETEPGSRIWVFLRDSRRPGDHTRAQTAPLWDGGGGFAGDAWSGVAQWGVPVSPGLLAEEERKLEADDVRRVDFGFSAGAERADDGSGYGLGMGSLSGKGSGGGSGMARDSIVLGGLDHSPYAGEADALGVVEGKPPGAYYFTVPAWVDGVELDVVVRTADGRWTTRSIPVDVTGPQRRKTGAPTAIPASEEPGQELVRLALSLPLDPQLYALSALDTARIGQFRGALNWPIIGQFRAPLNWPILVAAASRRASMQAGASPELALARHLQGETLTVTDANPIPDTHRAARVMQSLTLAASANPADVERARVAAERLLNEPDIEPWVRARAALTLWVVGADDEALRALPVGSDDALIAAARAVVSGTPDLAFMSRWWATARSEAAGASDRALVIHALAIVSVAQGWRAFSPVALAPPKVIPAHTPAGPETLGLTLEQPLARWQGEDFPRVQYVAGTSVTGPDGALTFPGRQGISPAGRTVPLWVTVPAHPLPTRLSCPNGALQPWVDLAPSLRASRLVDCSVHAATPPTSPPNNTPTGLTVSWHDPEGGTLATASASLTVTPSTDSNTSEAMSDGERYALGMALTLPRPSPSAPPAGPPSPAGFALLESLQHRAELPPDLLESVSTTLVRAAVLQEPEVLIRAFHGFREQVAGGSLDLSVAAALAHAYAAPSSPDGGDPGRALAAIRVVMDARFREELAAVASLRGAGLDLTALKLLRELVLRYPETPTVSHARFLQSAMLLGRAEGDGDRLGYTRSSLRHTAAAGLSAFLLLHPEAWDTATSGHVDEAARDVGTAAAALSDALAALGDDARQQALAGPLSRAFAARPDGWQLALAEAHATSTRGDNPAALQILDRIRPPDGDGRQRVALERGRVLEALGRSLDARLAFEAAGRAGSGEALARLAWLDRSEFEVPPLLILAPGMPQTVPADLRPGTEVTVTAIAIQLDAALLDSGGVVSADGIRVTGLRPTASTTLRVGANGDVPLPSLPDGAYLLTVTSGGATEHSLLVRSGMALAVGPAASTLVHLTTTGGRPLAGAWIWAFDAAGTATTTTTDATGSAFVPGYSASVLARLGRSYAIWVPTERDTGSRHRPPPAPAPSPRQYGESDYEDLFRQDANQQVDAAGL